MGTHTDLSQGGCLIRYDSGVLEPMEPRLFDPRWLHGEGHHIGGSAGRGEAQFFAFKGREMVLRRFLRGGLFGKLNKDLYFGTQLTRSRAFAEFDLLSWMLDQKLPVPRPVAAMVKRTGPFYRAAIITERIPNTATLEDVLRAAPLDRAVWRSIGSTIRQMHDAGVFHSDLNCRNILVDHEKRIWLIDFDKCGRRNAGGWTDKNLERLLRSLRKEDGKGAGLNWTAEDWSDLRAGYQGPETVGTGQRS